MTSTDSHSRSAGGDRRLSAAGRLTNTSDTLRCGLSINSSISPMPTCGSISGGHGGAGIAGIAIPCVPLWMCWKRLLAPLTPGNGEHGQGGWNLRATKTQCLQAPIPLALKRWADRLVGL